MRIVVLCHNLRFAGGLSVGKNVIATLRRVADEHEYLLVMPAGAGYESIELPSRSRAEYFLRNGGPLGAASQFWYDVVALEQLVRAWQPDVLWGLGNFGLKRPPCPQAVHYFDAHLVYDPRKQPKRLWDNGLDMRMVRWRLKRALPATGLVFCQTNTMLTRFRETFGFSGEMVVMPTAVSRYALTDPAVRPPVFERLAGKFVLLAVTRYYPHKNLEVLVEMFQRHSAELADVVVLVTIDPGQKYGVEPFMAKIADPRVSRHFVNVGPVKQSELAGYFQHSHALIQPTVLESFSVTYLEAMQFNTPILTSDMDFAREVCGEAALYFDPWDADAVFNTVQRFRASPEIGLELVRRGGDRMQSYVRSWEDIIGAAMRRVEALARGGRPPGA